MWTGAGTVLTVSSRALIAACERLGVDSAALLEAAKVSRETLADPDARLSAQQVGALWTRAYEMTGDPVLSLHAAELCPLGAYKVIDYMAHNARTVGEAFTYSARYFKLINTAVSLPIDASGDPVSFEIVDESRPEGVSRPYAEYCFAAFFLHVRAATGVPFAPRRLQFRHLRPHDITEHERLFGCPIEFGARRTRMLIARSAWETPTTGAQAGVLEVLAEHADLLLDRLPKGPDLVERTRKAIGQRLRGSDSSLEGVAAELAMTPRTLQRHLRELGYSYNALADEVRQGLARLYLQQPDIAIAEVAYLLGFADQSAFNRAFKRWNGLTPKQFRSGRGDTAKTARSDAIDDRRVGTSAHMPARRFPTPTSPGRFVDRSDSGRTMAWHIQPAGEERMGSLVDTLKTQHAAVQKMATEISQLVERTDIGAISAKLTSLKTALLGHLDLEDKKLYPALIKAAQKKDPAAAETARMFATNMVGISRVLIEFLGKYEGKKFSADAFAQDWQGILGALAARINSEEATLYPLYEKWTK